MSAFAKALEEGKFNVSGVCTDCLMAKENGDTSGNDPGWDAEQFNRTNELYEAAIGHPHDGEWWTDCSHHGQPCPDDADCDCEKNTFSTSQCGMCGAYLHGERHDYVFIERALL